MIWFKSYFLDVKSVGLYNVGSNIAKELTIISVPIVIGVAPLFISVKNAGMLLRVSIKKILFMMKPIEKNWINGRMSLEMRW